MVGRCVVVVVVVAPARELASGAPAAMHSHSHRCSRRCNPAWGEQVLGPHKGPALGAAAACCSLRRVRLGTDFGIGSDDLKSSQLYLGPKQQPAAAAAALVRAPSEVGLRRHSELGLMGKIAIENGPDFAITVI